MKRLVPILVLSIMSTVSIYAQDIIILQNNERIKCDIIYEKPAYYKIKHIQGDMKKKYGSRAEIHREQVRGIIDNDDPIIIKKFGKVKIWLRNEDKAITKPFYSANRISISVIQSTYKSNTGRKQYQIIDFPIDNIERIKWKKGNAHKGTIIGAGIGLVATGVTFAVLVGPAEGDVTGALVGIAAAGLGGGAILGTIAGITLQKSEKIELNGDLLLWEQEKSKLPPSGFRAHDN